MADQKSNEAEGRESEATFSCSLLSYSDSIATKKVDFITLNPYKKGKSFKRLQRISAVYDILRRSYSHIFIVQETNSDKTKHYHALGVHDGLTQFKPRDMKIHIQALGETEPLPAGSRYAIESAFTSAPEPTPEERAEAFIEESLRAEMSIHHHLFDVTCKLLCACKRFQMKKKRNYKATQKRRAKKLKLQGDIGRVINYMIKEIGNNPERYENYIIEKEVALIASALKKAKKPQ